MENNTSKTTFDHDAFSTSPELWVNISKFMMETGQMPIPPELEGKSPEEVDKFLREYFADLKPKGG